MYDATDANKFLLGSGDEGEPLDVPRNTQGRALIGDLRNDDRAADPAWRPTLPARSEDAYTLADAIAFAG